MKNGTKVLSEKTAARPDAGGPRQGFINPDLFEKLLAALPEKLQPLVIFLYYTGCRLGAARQITWPMVNADVQAILRHAEVETTMAYYVSHLAMNKLAEAFSRAAKQSGKRTRLA
jgi:integrase